MWNILSHLSDYYPPDVYSGRAEVVISSSYIFVAAMFQRQRVN